MFHAVSANLTATQLKLSDTNSQAWTQEGRERPSIKITGVGEMRGG